MKTPSLPKSKLFLSLALGVLGAGVLHHINNIPSDAELAALAAAPHFNAQQVVAQMRDYGSVWHRHERQLETLQGDVQAKHVLLVGVAGTQATNIRLLVTRTDGGSYYVDLWPGQDLDAVLAAVRASGAVVAYVGHTPDGSSDISLLSIAQLVLLALLLVPMASTLLAGRQFEIAEKPTTQFRDVIGATEAKAALQDIVDYLRAPKAFAAVGAQPPKGVLLAGPPGTGKTLLAKALAGEANAKFIACSGADFSSQFVGTGIAKVKMLFKKARKHSPCIVFIDEVDGLGRRGGMESAAAAEGNRIINQILVELDGFKADERIIVIAATNHLDNIDPALRREGRIDRVVTLALPTLEERDAVLRYYGQRIQADQDVDYAQLARLTTGLAPATLAAIMNHGAILAARKGQATVTMADLTLAVEIKHMGEANGRPLSDDDRERVAIHEAGHALIAQMHNTGTLEKVSILPRGQALGVTLVTNHEDQQLRTRAQIAAQVEMLLAGRAAEELVLGEASTGASNDLARASQLAVAMVTRYGMGGSLLALAEIDEQTALQQAAEDARAFLEERYAQVKARLAEQRAALDSIAAQLLAHETIPGTAVAAALAG